MVTEPLRYKACKSISYSRVLDEKKVGRGIIFGFWVFTSIITPFLAVVGPLKEHYT